MKKNNLNFAFFGTPDVAADTLTILKESGFLPSLVVTSPDKPKGRKMIVTPSPVKIWAEENNIELLQPETFDSSITNNLKAKNCQLFVVVAYGKILPKGIIDMPPLGSLNVHYSLLPKYRGASPVESAILNGETETGVTIQKMAFKMDTGPIVAQERVAILPEETAPQLRKRLTKVGGELLAKTLMTPYFSPQSTDEGAKIIEVVQDESQATYCTKIKKQDGLVNLEKESPETLYNKFRAYALWPRIFFFKDGKRIIITDAKLEDGKFIIKRVLPEGGKEKEYRENKG